MVKLKINFKLNLYLNEGNYIFPKFLVHYEIPVILVVSSIMTPTCTHYRLSLKTKPFNRRHKLSNHWYIYSMWLLISTLDIGSIYLRDSFPNLLTCLKGDTLWPIYCLHVKVTPYAGDDKGLSAVWRVL